MRTIVITGAGAGLGAAIVAALEKPGDAALLQPDWNVFKIDRKFGHDVVALIVTCAGSARSEEHERECRNPGGAHEQPPPVEWSIPNARRKYCWRAQ